MLSEKIQSINVALGGLLSRVDPESAAFIRVCRRNLEATAEQVRELEASGVFLPSTTSPSPAARPTN